MKLKRTIIIICTIFILIGAAGGIFYFYDIKNSENQIEVLKEKMPENERSESQKKDCLDYYLIDGKKIQENMKDLYMENQDFVGWLTIDNTSIDYPVMQCRRDMNYYLHRGYDKEYSGQGSLFANILSNISAPSDNILIYGHHMITDTMFHSLTEYENEEYYKKHKYITFDSIYRTGTYEVIAAFRTKIQSDEDGRFVYYNFFDARNKDEYNNYIDNIKKLTPYQMDSTAEYGDKLITLSTCAYHTKNGRFVVVAKQINGLEITNESICLGEIVQ